MIDGPFAVTSRPFLENERARPKVIGPFSAVCVPSPEDGGARRRTNAALSEECAALAGTFAPLTPLIG
jgi:hypothetical protein